MLAPTHFLISSSILSQHSAHTGAAHFSTSPSPLTNLNYQQAYDDSLPVLLPLLVRTIIPSSTPPGSALSLILLGPGATSLGLSLLSLPTRDEENHVKLPGNVHLVSIELSHSPTSLPLLPPVNPLSNVTPTTTKLIIYDDMAVPGENNLPPVPDYLSSKLPVQALPPKSPPVTYFISEIGVSDGWKKYSCTFFIPRGLLAYRTCCELTMHPISSGGSYYELKLVPNRPGVDGLLQGVGGISLKEDRQSPREEDDFYYIETQFVSPKPDFTATKLLKVLKERIRSGGVPDGVGECTIS